MDRAPITKTGHCCADDDHQDFSDVRRRVQGVVDSRKKLETSALHSLTIRRFDSQRCKPLTFQFVGDTLSDVHRAAHRPSRDTALVDGHGAGLCDPVHRPVRPHDPVLEPVERRRLDGEAHTSQDVVAIIRV